MKYWIKSDRIAPGGLSRVEATRLPLFEGELLLGVRTIRREIWIEAVGIFQQREAIS